MQNENSITKKRLTIFLAFAFGISWLSAVIIFLSGGLINSPEVIPGTGITLALILMASVYMWGPALANLLTRWITREGWQNAFLNFSVKKNWRWWLAGWFGPALLTILGCVLFFLVLPSYFDPGMQIIKNQLGTGTSGPSVTQIVIIQTSMALLISPLLNLVSTFGEEFGWRAYLLPKLVSFGTRRALIISSLIWGVWHWPAILMGHNYGLEYWGYPFSGLLATLWIMFCIGVFIGWLALRSQSVWPAVFAHGSLNGTAAIGMLFLSRQAPMLLGPTPAGIIAVIPFTVIAILILLKSDQEKNSIKETE